MIERILLGAGAAALAITAQIAAVHAQDAYVIGVTGALTGPAAGTNGPPIEGLRLYVDRLNAAGGINGKKIQLTVLDDQGEPSKAAAMNGGAPLSMIISTPCSASSEAKRSYSGIELRNSSLLPALKFSNR